MFCSKINLRCLASTSQRIDGKKIASEIRKTISEEIKTQKIMHNTFQPGLAIVQVGHREDSNIYIRNKIKASQEVGILAHHIQLPGHAKQAEIIKLVNQLNLDQSINGMIVQLPMESSEPISADRVIGCIDPNKDVDGLHPENAGKLARGILKDTLIPCTPRGCLELVKSTGEKIAGKRVVVLGRSKIVGSPAAELFVWNHGTVTICHSKTVDLPGMVREADIVIAAIGRPEMVKGSWLKEGCVVIDCGINVVQKEGKDRIVGDVDFAEASQRAAFITPVPGGVGPMTIAMLLQNTFEQAKKKLVPEDEA